MRIIDWFLNKMTAKTGKEINVSVVARDLATEIYVRELSFNMVLTKISATLSKCPLNVYIDGKKKQGDEWYRWNIKPNDNQNATEFWNKLVYQLYNYNEALIVPVGTKLYIADTFNKEEATALYPCYFTGVTVNNLTFERRYYRDEVFYFKLGEQSTRRLLNNTLGLYAKLINACYSSYIMNNGQKGLLYIDQLAEQQEDFEETLNDLLNEQFSKFFNSSNSIMPMYQGYKYEPLENSKSGDTRDFRNLLNDVSELTANAFGIPKAIAMGESVTDETLNTFLTFCLDPLIELITDELNAQLFSKEQIKRGSKVKFDTKSIRHIDLLQVATSIDKLISSGCFTVNDIRAVCGEELINEDWANQFFMTKNYATVEEVMKGGLNGESIST